MNRRRFLTLAQIVTGLFGVPGPAWSRNAPAPVSEPQKPTPFDVAYAAELGTAKALSSDCIQLETPQIAEDGAVVPISLTADLPGVSELVILVEKNPTPLTARFRLAATAAPEISLRIKMNETCDVVALAKTADGVYTTRSNVRVLIGGCG